MDEYIYELLPHPEVVSPKAPLYHSKHNGATNPNDFEMGVRQPKLHATMGLASGNIAVDPAAYQKAHTLESTFSRGSGTKWVKIVRKDPVPLRAERPLMQERPPKDFVKLNALENINARPPPVDDQEYWYTSKPSFGKVPGYLTQTKRQIAEERAKMDAYLAAQEQEEQARELPQEEKELLVRLLKTKWQQLNSDFLKLPFSLDTPSKKKRKELYEAQLQQIEKDIWLLQRSEKLVITPG